MSAADDMMSCEDCADFRKCFLAQRCLRKSGGPAKLVHCRRCDSKAECSADNACKRPR